MKILLARSQFKLSEIYWASSLKSARLRNWCVAILGALEPVLTAKQMQIGNEAVGKFKTYLRMLVARRITEGRDPDTDVVTVLILAEDEAELSQTELLQN